MMCVVSLGLGSAKAKTEKRVEDGKETRTLLSRLNLSHSRLRHLSRRNNKISLKYKDEKLSKSFKNERRQKRAEKKLNFRGDKISRYLVPFYFGF